MTLPAGTIVKIDGEDQKYKLDSDTSVTAIDDEAPPETP